MAVSGTEIISEKLKAFGTNTTSSWVNLDNVNKLCERCQRVDWNATRLYLSIANEGFSCPKVAICSCPPTVKHVRVADLNSRAFRFMLLLVNFDTLFQHFIVQRVFINVLNSAWTIFYICEVRWTRSSRFNIANLTRDFVLSQLWVVLPTQLFKQEMGPPTYQNFDTCNGATRLVWRLQRL